jgi:hypothetical protein
VRLRNCGLTNFGSYQRNIQMNDRKAPVPIGPVLLTLLQLRPLLASAKLDMTRLLYGGLTISRNYQMSIPRDGWKALVPSGSVLLRRPPVPVKLSLAS